MSNFIGEAERVNSNAVEIFFPPRKNFDDVNWMNFNSMTPFGGLESFTQSGTCLSSFAFAIGTVDAVSERHADFRARSLVHVLYNIHSSMYFFRFSSFHFSHKQTISPRVDCKLIHCVLKVNVNSNRKANLLTDTKFYYFSL